MKNNTETKKMEFGELNEFSDLDTRFNGWFLISLAAILSLDDADASELMAAERAFTTQDRNVNLMLVGALGDKVSITPMGFYTTLNKAIEKVQSVFINHFTPDEDGKPSLFFNHYLGDLRIVFKHNGVNYSFVLTPSYIDCPVTTEEELALNFIVSPNEITFTA